MKNHEPDLSFKSLGMLLRIVRTDSKARDFSFQCIYWFM